MKTLAALALAKTGLLLAKTLVKLTSSQTDDKIIELLDAVRELLEKMANGNLEIRPEINAIIDAFEQLKSDKK